jgi:dipeptidyl-peptidase-4
MRVNLHLLYLIIGLSLANTAFAEANESKKTLSLESIFARNEFQNRTLQNIQWAIDEKSFTFTRQNPKTALLDIHSYDIASGLTELVIAGDKLLFKGKPVKLSYYQWSKDRNYLLLRGPSNLTWDGRSEAPFYIYESATQTLWPLAVGNPTLRNVQLSPDGSRIGYVLENNLYIADLKNQATRAITTDGSADIFNGFYDYGSSEFSRGNAWFWSPDGKKIAFWRLDATDVKVFYMVDELGKYNTVRPMKYPNAGERHAVNKIGVYNLKKDKTTWMDIGDNPDDYIPRINWTSSPGKLAIQRLRRDHEKLDLLIADVDSGKTTAIVNQTDTAWVDITHDLRFFNKQDRFIWTSEQSGYRHAYLYDLKGNEITQLTKGDWEISSIIELDEIAGWLYFYAKKDSFIDQHVYRVDLKGADVEKLSNKPGWYDWHFSPTNEYVIETYSSAKTPQQLTLKDADGKKVTVLEENKIEAMENYAMPHTEFIKVKTSDGILIDAYMIKPLDFNPDKKYPVIGYGYGNAGSQVVVNRWGTQRGPRQDLWHRYMAEQGYIIFAMDNRTTAGRGKAAKNLTHGYYGKYAVIDYLEGVKYLKSLPYVDPSRLGFWGWSGGGYMAAALMTKGAPHIKTAVSVAPVIDLKAYQTVGVERWMDSISDNPEGYFETNLINYADKLEGNLLLIHGTGDENVKFAFTLQFADALIKNNKQFDMMVYPNQHHGIRDAQLHVFTRISNYFLDKL